MSSSRNIDNRKIGNTGLTMNQRLALPDVVSWNSRRIQQLEQLANNSLDSSQKSNLEKELENKVDSLENQVNTLTNLVSKLESRLEHLHGTVTLEVEEVEEEDN